MALKFCCDFCDRQLPMKLSCDENGVKRIKSELALPKKIDIHEYFPHLCESCARKIDTIVDLYRVGEIKKTRAAERFAKINQERRVKLWTKG